MQNKVISFLYLGLCEANQLTKNLSASFSKYHGDPGEVLEKLYHVTSVEPPHVLLSLHKSLFPFDTIKNV